MSTRSKKKLFIVDGHSFCYRAFYAIRELSNSKGEPTNAIYGFIMMLRKLLADNHPTHIAICFDSEGPTFRHEQYEDYKANRKPMPDDLSDQMESIKDVCRAYRWEIFEARGFEADDIIGTLARQAEEKGFEVYILTGDKDAMQLVTDSIKILNPHKESVIIDRSQVKKKLDGLLPENVVDFMALTGDSSDNIPGVAGVGAKTAAKLIQEFGDIDNLYKNLEKIKSKSQRAKLADNEDNARMSKELATINTEVPVKVNWDSLEMTEPDTETLLELFKRFEFRAFMRDLEPGHKKAQEKRNYQMISTEKDLKELVKKLEESEAFGFDTETTHSDPMRASLVGMSFCTEAMTAYYVPVSSKKHEGSGIAIDKALELLKPVLEDSKQKKYGQNIKYDWIVMKREGVDVRGIAFDTMIASYLINPLKLNHNLDDIALEYLGIKKIDTKSLLGSGKSEITMDKVALEDITNYACEDADCVFRLVPLLSEKLKDHQLVSLFDEVELPLSIVLAKMEMNGVKLDVKFMKELADKVGDDIEKLTASIYKEAGEEFNINSPKQLGHILFEKMEIPPIKKTKTGFSTDVSVLEKLAAQQYKLPEMILTFRERAKLKSTYLDALPVMINPETQRIHTSYNQTTTATGRLSSTEPNLQNIPIRTEEGRLVRKAFVAEGKQAKILSADYSQIELRILAHLSGDKNLTRAFEEDRDVHAFTATLLFDVKESEVSREERNIAKTINFSIIYGKTAYGLSQDLSISIPEAEGFIENYFGRYKKIREYLESQKDLARKNGYLTTLLGRRSYFPDIQSRNMHLRQFAERAAINAPIQGTAADLIKLAMISIQDKLDQGKNPWIMTMQVHDELVFEIPGQDSDSAVDFVRSEMEGAYKLDVPLKVDVTVGDSWYKN